MPGLNGRGSNLAQALLPSYSISSSSKDLFFQISLQKEQEKKEREEGEGEEEKKVVVLKLCRTLRLKRYNPSC